MPEWLMLTLELEICMKQIAKLCEKCDLGLLKSAPQAVTGGLMHTMYHACTDKGEYAIKVLNPGIMKRPEALRNMMNSEMVSNALIGAIPVAAAKCFAGKHILELNASFYIVFDWLEGKSLFAPNISAHHCGQVGRILGQIHAANLQIDSIEKCSDIRAAYDWKGLFQEAQHRSAECHMVLQENMADILRWDQHAVRSLQQVSQHQVISHRDLDPKNVMWNNEEAYIIDWEAAGYVNPFQELIEVLNYWIADESGAYHRAKFDAMIQAYTENMNIRNVDWDAVSACSFDGMLGWLEYNIKRALGLEGNSARDLQEGMKQTKETIYELKKYEKQVGQLMDWINESVASIGG